MAAVRRDLPEADHLLNSILTTESLKSALHILLAVIQHLAAGNAELVPGGASRSQQMSASDKADVELCGAIGGNRSTGAGHGASDDRQIINNCGPNEPESLLPSSAKENFQGERNRMLGFFTGLDVPRCGGTNRRLWQG